MAVTALYFDQSTGITIQVHTALSETLAPEVFANIRNVQVSYNMMNDEFDFTVWRLDDQAVKFGLARTLFEERDKVWRASDAFRQDPQLLARLILFLAP